MFFSHWFHRYPVVFCPSNPLKSPTSSCSVRHSSRSNLAANSPLPRFQAVTWSQSWGQWWPPWPPWGQWGRYDLPHCLIGLDYLDSWSGKSIKTGISIHRCTDWYWLLTQEIIAAETNIQLLPALNPTRPLHVPKPLLSSKRTKLLASAPLPTKSPWPTETNSHTNPNKARQQNIVNIVNEPSTRHL